MHVYTGAKANAGTDSRVNFVIAGTEADTGVLRLDDGARKNFQTADVNPFLLQTYDYLGVPAYIRIWHDSSGKGNKASWFLSKIVIVDLQTKQWYLFKCDKWLARDEDDGRTERILRMTSEQDVSSDSELLTNNMTKALWNDHLWLSIGYRKSRSTFTRAQRLSSCLALLFLTMVANAMFYGSGGDDTQQAAFTVGPLSVTMQQMYASIASSVVIVPPILLITTLFSKSRPPKRKAQPGKSDNSGKSNSTTNAHNKANKYQKQNETVAPMPQHAGATCSNPLEGDAQAKTEETRTDSGLDTDDSDPLIGIAIHRKLPYWCNYIAWLLVLLCIAAGSFFTILYALQWGKHKSETWLLTFFLSFVESLLLIQPIKVRLCERTYLRKQMLPVYVIKLFFVAIYCC